MVGFWPHSPPATVKNLFTAAAIIALTVTAPVVASAQYRYQWSYQDFQEYQRQQAEQARAVEQQREQAAREQAEREQAAREQQEELARQQRQTALAELRERQRAVSNQQYWLQYAGDNTNAKAMTREDFLVDGKDIADQRVVVHGPYSINVRGAEFLAFQTVTQIVLQTDDADRAGRKVLFECKEHSCPDITVVGLAGTCAMTETNELTGITHDVPAQPCINVQTVYDTKVFIESMRAQDRPMPLYPPTVETAASTDEQSAVTASTSPGTGGAPQLFKQGLRDRTNWELWFNSLDGDTKAGANYWAAQRSLAHPGNCGGTPDFSRGCYEAKVKLDESDTLRKSQPAYKAGWNSYITQAVNN